MIRRDGRPLSFLQEIEQDKAKQERLDEQIRDVIRRIEDQEIRQRALALYEADPHGFLSRFALLQKIHYGTDKQIEKESFPHYNQQWQALNELLDTLLHSGFDLGVYPIWYPNESNFYEIFERTGRGIAYKELFELYKLAPEQERALPLEYVENIKQERENLYQKIIPNFLLEMAKKIACLSTGQKDPQRAFSILIDKITSLDKYKKSVENTIEKYDKLRDKNKSDFLGRMDYEKRKTTTYIDPIVPEYREKRDIYYLRTHLIEQGRPKEEIARIIDQVVKENNELEKEMGKVIRKKVTEAARKAIAEKIVSGEYLQEDRAFKNEYITPVQWFYGDFSLLRFFREFSTSENFSFFLDMGQVDQVILRFALYVNSFLINWLWIAGLVFEEAAKDTRSARLLARIDPPPPPLFISIKSAKMPATKREIQKEADKRLQIAIEAETKAADTEEAKQERLKEKATYRQIQQAKDSIEKAREDRRIAVIFRGLASDLLNRKLPASLYGLKDRSTLEALLSYTPEDSGVDLLDALKLLSTSRLLLKIWLPHHPLTDSARIAEIIGNEEEGFRETARIVLEKNHISPERAARFAVDFANYFIPKSMFLQHYYTHIKTKKTESRPPLVFQKRTLLPFHQFQDAIWTAYVLTGAKDVKDKYLYSEQVKNDLADSVRRYKLFASLGIHSTADLHFAQQYIEDILTKSGFYEEIEKSKQRERQASLIQDIALSNTNDFFPTPRSLFDEAIKEDVVEWARSYALPFGQPLQFLEPSAGIGWLIDATLDALRAARIDQKNPVEIHAVEYHSTTCKFLKGKYKDAITVTCGDFLSYADETRQRFDLIVMNPPFSKGQDQSHVLRAFDLLKRGGLLVAITSSGAVDRSDRKTQEFNQFLERQGARVDRNPEGAFQREDALTTTGVSTVTIQIVKKDPAKLDIVRIPNPPYPFLSLDVVEAFLPLARELDVSGVARGDVASSSGDQGFLSAYRQAGGNWRRLDRVSEEEGFGADYWERKRHGFIRRHLEQIEQNNRPLWITRKGKEIPSRQHLALIIWAYSPEPRRVKAWAARQ